MEVKPRGAGRIIEGKPLDRSKRPCITCGEAHNFVLSGEVNNQCRECYDKRMDELHYPTDMKCKHCNRRVKRWWDGLLGKYVKDCHRECRDETDREAEAVKAYKEYLEKDDFDGSET